MGRGDTETWVRRAPVAGANEMVTLSMETVKEEFTQGREAYSSLPNA